MKPPDRRPAETRRGTSAQRRRRREAARRAAIIDGLRRRLPELSVPQLQGLRDTLEDVLSGKRITAADYQRLGRAVGESDRDMSL